jgi:hypothetical protein
MANRRPDSPVPVYDQSVMAELDEVRLVERIDNRAEVLGEQPQQGVVGDVAGGDDEEPPWAGSQQVAVAEVTVLADHDPVVCVGEASDLGIRCSVLVWQR